MWKRLMLVAGTAGLALMGMLAFVVVQETPSTAQSPSDNTGCSTAQGDPDATHPAQCNFWGTARGEGGYFAAVEYGVAWSIKDQSNNVVVSGVGPGFPQLSALANTPACTTATPCIAPMTYANGVKYTITKGVGKGYVFGGDPVPYR